MSPANGPGDDPRPPECGLRPQSLPGGTVQRELPVAPARWCPEKGLPRTDSAVAPVTPRPTGGCASTAARRQQWQRAGLVAVIGFLHPNNQGLPADKFYRMATKIFTSTII
jgi:hypothetical protein